MEFIPFLIFAVIAFNIFRGFTKAASKSTSHSGETAKEMMRRLQEQTQTPNMSRYQNNTPTQRGRESLQRKEQSSPWGDNGAVNPGGRVAVNYLRQKTQQQKAKTARKASHKSPKQTGRRGVNVDQNRNRTDEWGQRGESGFLSGSGVILFLVGGAVILFVLSQLPAN